jgi:hypothetical protein
MYAENSYHRLKQRTAVKIKKLPTPSYGNIVVHLFNQQLQCLYGHPDKFWGRLRKTAIN